MNELKSADQLVEDYRKFSHKNVKCNVRCNACHVPLTSHEAAKGELIYSLRKAWHRDHFICVRCHCSIGGGGLDFRESPTDRHYPICLDCFMEENHPKCEACDRVLRETCLKAVGKLWHESCFTCAKCHSPFPQGKFCIFNGKPYDADCYFLTKYSQVLTPFSQLNRFVSNLVGPAQITSRILPTVPARSALASGNEDTSGLRGKHETTSGTTTPSASMKSESSMMATNS
uniref:LIM zinc-binding domain-containing protein n=1 Tax=Parascaris univalens TaxID=6257 RepID=A0A914ZZ60_PARUN